MKFNVSKYSTSQLLGIDRAIESFIFKQLGDEPFEPTYKKNPKQFRKLLNIMIDFKSELMKYFNKQYDKRWSLIRYQSIKASEDYFYDDEWYQSQQELAVIIDKFTRDAFDLGILVLLALLGRTSADYSSHDVQKQLMKHALKISGDINTTTQTRVKSAIDAANTLEEDRAAFENRIKKIFANPYRGRFIAQNEALNAYISGKNGYAKESGFKYKTWHGSQAIDEICGNTDGETIPIDKPFSNGLMQPLAHFNCKCDISYSETETTI